MGCVGFLPEQYQGGQESELGHGKAGYAGVLCTTLPLYDAFKTFYDEKEKKNQQVAGIRYYSTDYKIKL